MWKHTACCVRSPAPLIALKFPSVLYGELLSVFLPVGEGSTGKRKNP